MRLFLLCGSVYKLLQSAFNCYFVLLSKQTGARHWHSTKISECMLKKFAPEMVNLYVAQPTHRCPLQTALPLPFLSATDAHFHREQPIMAQNPAGSDVGNLSATPTPLKINGTGLDWRHFTGRRLGRCATSQGQWMRAAVMSPRVLPPAGPRGRGLA